MPDFDCVFVVTVFDAETKERALERARNVSRLPDSDWEVLEIVPDKATKSCVPGASPVHVDVVPG